MSKKILIIDDEQSICDMLQDAFKKVGYVALIETDPVKSLMTVEKEKPDCVLLDMNMPNIDGLETLSTIRAINPNIAVIMITGYGDLEKAMESMKLGAYDYITKPFDLGYIKDLVRNCIESAGESSK